MWGDPSPALNYRIDSPVMTWDKIYRDQSDCKNASRLALGFHALVRAGSSPACFQNVCSASRFICRFVGCSARPWPHWHGQGSADNGHVGAGLQQCYCTAVAQYVRRYPFVRERCVTSRCDCRRVLAQDLGSPGVFLFSSRTTASSLTETDLAFCRIAFLTFAPRALSAARARLRAFAGTLGLIEPCAGAASSLVFSEAREIAMA
jgi:hypothetical protein